MTRAERNRKKKSCLPLYLTIVLLLLGVATAVVLAKIPADAASLYGQPVGTLSFIDRLSLSINLLSNQRDLLEPLDPAGAPVSFVIEDGDSVASIAVGIAEYMQDPRSHEINFAILPGWRLEEIAASLPSSGLAITPEEFLSVTRNEGVSNLDGRLPAGLTSLEGYLLPGEYAVYRGATIAELLPLLLSRFFETITGDLSLAFTNQGLSLDQAVILASMVEREAILDEEMPMIASVFLNRLAAGMRLESDPTVQYALGVDDLSAGWWKVPLDGGDLAVDSPFNTYLYGGLPPAPICNPSIGALQAVAYPAYSGNYFFRAACDGSGSHNFSATYEEHLNNACE
jgi:UPF0755 protein